MKDKLNIALLQNELHWHAKEANMAMFEEQVWGIENQVDILVLPEMFNTGFTMEVTKQSEPTKSKTLRWMQQIAAQKKAVVTGSFIAKEGTEYFNRLVWVEPNGSFKHYDKRHLFQMAGEDKYFTAGSEKLVCELHGWKIAPFVCYDLRFPVWSRNTDLDYDVAFYVANWPTARISAWDTLLAARAMENLCYVAGVNRIGSDDMGIDYCGHSAIYSGKGECCESASDKKTVLQYALDASELNHLRKKFPAHLDADKFKIL